MSRLSIPILALVLAYTASAQTLARTEIRDTLFNADGTTIEGVATIRWKSFTAVDGSTVANSRLALQIVEGVIAVDLTPNEGATPTGLSYRVDYVLSDGNSFTETWVVPQSASEVTVSDIRVPLPPVPAGNLSLSQVLGLTAELNSKADLDGPNYFLGLQTIRESFAGENLLGLELDDGSEGVYFRLPPLAASTNYALPPTDGLPSQHLTTDGTGHLFWSNGGSSAVEMAYEVMQQAGAALTQRTIANFSNGLLATDNPAQTRTEIQPLFGAGAGTIAQGNDARLSDARTPLAHAASHGTAGSDALTPLSIGALKRTNDSMAGTVLDQPVLKVQGLSGQTAALQEWRDGSGNLVGSITSEGSAFFREMGIAAKVGGTVVSHFFQLDGKNKFALSAVDGVFDVIRYDDAGAFKDRPLRVLRSGNILTTVGMEISNATVGSGALKLSGDYADFQAVAAPSSPPVDTARVFVNSVTGEVSAKKSSGAVVSLESGGGGGGGSFGVFVDAEVPSGTIDGVNDEFTLGAAPNPPQSLELAKNGVVQTPGTDFNVSGSTVTFLAAAIPQTGDQLTAWYRTSSADAAGDLSGTYPSPTVIGVQGRAVASAAPLDGECLAWNGAASAWEPATCGVVRDELAWHFAGAPGTGANPMVLTLPDGIVSAALENARITVNSTGSSATTYNIERCVSACTGTTPNFSAIYGVNQTLAASTRTVAAGTPSSTTANGGDQFRVNLATAGAGVGDVTVTLVYSHRVSAGL